MQQVYRKRDRLQSVCLVQLSQLVWLVTLETAVHQFCVSFWNNELCNVSHHVLLYHSSCQGREKEMHSSCSLRMSTAVYGTIHWLFLLVQKHCLVLYISTVRSEVYGGSNQSTGCSFNKISDTMTLYCRYTKLLIAELYMYTVIPENSLWEWCARAWQMNLDGVVLWQPQLELRELYITVLCFYIGLMQDWVWPDLDNCTLKNHYLYHHQLQYSTVPHISAWGSIFYVALFT